MDFCEHAWSRATFPDSKVSVVCINNSDLHGGWTRCTKLFTQPISKAYTSACELMMMMSVCVDVHDIAVLASVFVRAWCTTIYVGTIVQNSSNQLKQYGQQALPGSKVVPPDRTIVENISRLRSIGTATTVASTILHATITTACKQHCASACLHAWLPLLEW